MGHGATGLCGALVRREKRVIASEDVSEEERNGGGGDSCRRTRFTDSHGLITYKRRKRSSPGLGSALGGLPSVFSESQKAMDKPHLSYVGASERCHTRIEQCWKAILEETLISDDLIDDGITNCIQKALASSLLHFTGNLNAHAAQAKYTHEENGNLHGKAEGVDSFFNAAKKQEVAFSELQRLTNEEENACLVTNKCQNVLLEVLVSEKFAFLCNLLLGNFPGIKARSIIDFSQINSKMKNETYGHSIGRFHQDLQQVWERIQKIGQEMVLLANSLSNISQTACQKQRPVGFGAEKSDNSHTTTQIPCESEPSTKPEQTGASCLYKISICKQCGTEADGKCSLICDGCEAPYHFSCVKPAIQGIPTQNWYCSTCSKDQRESVEPDATNSNQDCPHENCVVCDKLKALGVCEQPVQDDDENVTAANNSIESSISGMDSEESPQPSRSVSSHLCKICRTCEDDEGKFILCGHELCLYKYYHIRCLRNSQIATQHQRHGCWYCPSCLCRACLIDKDDDMIVMCDGCDEGYHVYCMKPPCTSVPEGKWYCLPCNISRAKEGMRRYEQWVLRQHGQSNGKLSGGSG